jgi:xylulokinase
MSLPVGSDLLLGIDVGTSLLKAGLYAPDGSRLGAGQARQGVNTPQPRWAEQDPAIWWRGAKKAVRHALRAAAVLGDAVAAVGISTQGGTIALFDSAGKPCAPALVWSDQRQLSPDQSDPDAREQHFAVTGIAGRHMSPAAIAWLKAHLPGCLARARRVGYVPDYMTFRLTGNWISDPTNLSISNLLDLATLDIASAVLARLEIPRSMFAETRRAGEVAGHLLPSAARELGLRAGIPVATPAHDQYAAALGAGCTREGDLLLSCGTAWVLLLTTRQPITDRASSFIPGPHVQPAHWGLMGVISSGSATLDRVLVLTGGRADFDRIDAAVADVPAGSGGVIVIPHLLGRTLPTRDAHARGAILGLSQGHRREHLWRAAMEGLACETRAACDYLRQRGAAVSELRMVGGATRSPIWPRIIASVLGVPVLTQSGGDIAVRGAACLAARALGRQDLPAAEAWSSHGPIAEWREPYQELYARYQDAVTRLES